MYYFHLGKIYFEKNILTDFGSQRKSFNFIISFIKYFLFN
jgi:hypothetical protein